MGHRGSHGAALELWRCGLPMLLGMLPILLAIVLALPAVAAAEGLTGLPPRPTPPRPTPSLPDPPPIAAPRRSSGAHIRLIVAPEIAGGTARLDIWTVVQWEDEAGAWHDVDGWSGHLDDASAGTKTWWVSTGDLSRGPFRWAIFRSNDGSILAASAPFELPSHSGQVLDVSVALP